METPTAPWQPEMPEPVPLPSGEHPWARSLRVRRKLISAADLLVTAAITYVMYRGVAQTWSLRAERWLGSPWLRALAFSAWLFVAYGIPTLPAGFARHVLDRRYGLSTQTAWAWFADAIKGALIAMVLGSIGILGLTAALLWTGAHWWWVTAIGAALFGVVLTRLAPQLLIPIFFKMKPLENEGLQKRFLRLGETTGTPVLGIYEIDLSRRTNAANAAVVGFGASRRALVGDTLLAKFSEDEIEFVLAHELAHHRYHDLWKGIAISTVITTASLYVADLVIRPTRFDPLLLFWIAVITTIVGAVLSPVSRAYSRRAETRADAFAAQATAKASAGATAFRRLGFQNLAVFQPPVWEELLLYTHPSIARRITRLSK